MFNRKKLYLKTFYPIGSLLNESDSPTVYSLNREVIGTLFVPEVVFFEFEVRPTIYIHVK